MGTNTNQKTKINQEIATDIVQVSTSYCNISVDVNFDNNNIIVIGNNGDFDFSQRATIENATCNMNSSLDSQIENIIKSLIDTSASAQNGFTLDFTNINQQTSVYQTISNSMTQMMSATCNITASSNRSNNYIYLVDNDGNFDFSQTATIDGATCNMSNIAKSTSYNESSSDSSQESKITSIFGLMFAAIALCMILGVVIIGIVLVTGSVGKSKSGGSSSTGGIDPSIVNKALADLNPTPSSTNSSISYNPFTQEQLKTAINTYKSTVATSTTNPGVSSTYYNPISTLF